MKTKTLYFTTAFILAQSFALSILFTPATSHAAPFSAAKAVKPDCDYATIFPTIRSLGTGSQLSQTQTYGGAPLHFTFVVKSNQGSDCRGATHQIKRSSGGFLNPIAIQASLTGQQTNYPTNSTTTVTYRGAAPTEPGLYDYQLCVEDRMDTAKDNNCSPFLHFEVMPDYHDLVLVSKQAPSSVFSGEQFQLNVSIKNTGWGTVPDGTIKVFKLNSLDGGNNGQLVGSTTLGRVERKSGPTDHRLLVAAPGSGGKHYYSVCVEQHALANDTNFGNNCKKWEQSAQQGTNLVFENFTISGSSTKTPGEFFQLKGWVRNAGQNPSQDATAYFVYSADQTIDLGDRRRLGGNLQTIPLGKIAPGTRKQIVADISSGDLPSDNPRPYLGGCVEPYFGDSNRTDNCSTAGSITISNGRGNQSDIVTRSVELITANPAIPASTTTINVDLGNTGMVNSLPSQLQLYRSLNTCSQLPGDRITSRPVPSIDSGATHRVSIAGTLPTEVGEYCYQVCVDAVSGESNPNNNCSTEGSRITVEESSQGGTGTIQIRNAQQNIICTDPVTGNVLSGEACNPDEEPTLKRFTTPPLTSVTALLPNLKLMQMSLADGRSKQAGQWSEVNVVVKNQGTGTASDTHITLYQSTGETLSRNDRVLNGSTFRNLAAGEQVQVPIAFKVDDIGNHFLYACFGDVTNSEKSSQNCLFFTPLTIVAAEGTTVVDLVVLHVSEAGPMTLRPNQQGTMTLKISNRGNVASVATQTFQSIHETTSQALVPASDKQQGVRSVLADGEVLVRPTFTAPTTPGNYEFKFCVDPPMGEATQDNNCRKLPLIVAGDPVSEQLAIMAQAGTTSLRNMAGTLVTKRVDTTVGSNTRTTDIEAKAKLRITSFDASLSGVAAQTNEVGISMELRNAGLASSGPVQIHVFQSHANQSCSTRDSSLFSADVSNIDALEISPRQWFHEVPSESGQYCYMACLISPTNDPGTENCSAPSIVQVGAVQQAPTDQLERINLNTLEGDSVGQQTADLALRNLTLSGTEAKRPGEYFSLASTLRVVTQEPLSLVSVSYYRSNDNIQSGDDTQVNQNPNGYVSGNVGAGDHSSQITEQAPTQLGNYYYYACVHEASNNQIRGNDCTNIAPVEVSGEPSSVDIELVSLDSAAMQTLSGGNGYDLPMLIRNNGTASSMTSQLEIVAIPEPGQSPQSTSTSTLNAIPGAGDLNFTGRLTAPSQVGRWQMRACIQPQPDDANINNNCQIFFITVTEEVAQLERQAEKLTEESDGEVRQNNAEKIGDRSDTQQLAVLTPRKLTALKKIEPAARPPRVFGQKHLQQPTPIKQKSLAANPDQTFKQKAFKFGQPQRINTPKGNTLTQKSPTDGIQRLETTAKTADGAKLRTLNTLKKPIKPTRSQLPNLVLGSIIQKGSARVKPGDRITLQLTIYNKGSAKASASEVKLMRLKNTRARSSSSIMARKPVSAMDKGKSRRYRFQVTAPNQPGVIIIGACTKVVPKEQKRADNCARPLSISVQGAQARTTFKRLK